jgi:GntR family transcriptional regulator
MADDLDFESAVPLYRQLAGRLRERIARDSLARLPSLLAICQEYDVSRPTAEAAVKILVDAGEAEVVPGKGTYVTGGGHREGT